MEWIWKEEGGYRDGMRGCRELGWGGSWLRG